MKKNDLRELHNKSEKELLDQVQQIRSELEKMNLTTTEKRGTNVRLGRFIKDDLARVLTILAKKEIKK